MYRQHPKVMDPKTTIAAITLNSSFLLIKFLRYRDANGEYEPTPTLPVD